MLDAEGPEDLNCGLIVGRGGHDGRNWRDNIPENMQDGEKANQLDEAISNIEEFISNLESAEGVDVEFPRMIG